MAAALALKVLTNPGCAPASCLSACAAKSCALRVIRGASRPVLSRKEEECCNRATD